MIPRPAALLRYQGSKYRLADWVIRHFPPHLTYVEPFAGSAAVLLRKQRSRTEILNDVAGDVTRMFRVLRDRPDELARLLCLTPFSRDEYATLYEPTDCDLEAARRFIARSFMGQNSKGAFKRSGFDARNNPDHFISRARSLALLPDRIAAIAGRLTGVLIENRDALELVAQFGVPGALIYADPPYLGKRAYYANSFGIQRHQTLLDALQACGAMVVLSGYGSELYDRQLQGWTRSSTKSRTDGGERVETIWLNPAASAALELPRAAE